MAGHAGQITGHGRDRQLNLGAHGQVHFFVELRFAPGCGVRLGDPFARRGPPRPLQPTFHRGNAIKMILYANFVILANLRLQGF